VFAKVVNNCQDRRSLSRNLNEVSITLTHSRVENDIRLLTNQETEDQEEERGRPK